MTSNCYESTDLPVPVQPKRKRNYFFPKVYPFPIVRDDSEETGQWNCVIGHIKDQCVQITDEQNMRLLFTMGFFGKGTLSRSTPKALEKSLKEEHRERTSKKTNSLPNDQQDGHTDKQTVDSTENNIKVENPAKRRKKDEIEVVLSDSESSHSCDDETNENSSDKLSVTTTVPDEKEALQLSLEEAFFLSYGLGVLVVKDKDQPLDLMRLWHKFCEIHPSQSFPVMYTAYHHFRSKGWIVRSGLKYGVDFALYKDGPPFFHSSYAVIVKPVKEQNMRDITTGCRPNLTWSSLSGLTRMCSHVSKAVIILYVIKPTSISENKISTPFCVSQYKLEEVIVNRWVPSSSRSDT